MSEPAMIRVAASNFSERPGFDGVSENHHVSLPSQGILALADGLGGTTAGRQAASLACASVVEFLQREARDQEATLPFVLRSYLSLPANVLFNALVHANRRLLAVNADRGVHEKGAASIVAGFVDRQSLALASVGSVSAWLEREGRMEELLRPRTWGRLQDPVRPPPGWMSRIPLSALGVVADLEPEIIEFRLRPGDRVHIGTGVSAGIDNVQEFQYDMAESGAPEKATLTWGFE